MINIMIHREKFQEKNKNFSNNVGLTKIYVLTTYFCISRRLKKQSEWVRKLQKIWIIVMDSKSTDIENRKSP